MKIFYLLFFPFSFLQKPFINGFLKNNNRNRNLRIQLPFLEKQNRNFINNNNDIINLLQEKKKGFLQIIRPKNILPTFMLAFSGGWIMNPSLLALLSNPSFIITSVNIVLIMSSSMIINDLFDIEIDKVNHPSRPLVTGLVTKWEAVLYTFFLLLTTHFLSIHFLSSNLQFIINTSILGILLYTPFFKRILFMKNIFCASLVAFSLFVGGVASTNKILELNPNFNILSIALSLVFQSSVYSELLLDIRDYEGDRANNIITVPVLFGKENAWILSGILLFYNIISNTFSLMYIRNDGAFFTGTAASSPYNNTSGSAANLVVTSAGSLERSTSSIKYKKDVKDYDKGLAEVLKMRPVYYKSINEREKDLQFSGLIAEEIHELGLTEFVQYAEDGTPDALAYQNMIALLTKAIQELSEKLVRNNIN